MKRFIFFAGMAAVMAFSGCAAEIPMAKPNIDKCFSAEAEIKTGGEIFKGTISRTGESCWELYVSEPFALEGLVVTADDEGTKMSMAGFEADADVSVKAVSAIRVIMQAYEAAIDGADNYADGCFTGECQQGGYKIIISEDGCPESISVSEKEIVTKLSEWSELVVHEEDVDAELE